MIKTFSKIKNSKALVTLVWVLGIIIIPHFSVMREIINYCNSQNFPLMKISWKIRIVDISRDFCNQIILKERKEETIGETVKNLFFFPDDYKKHIPVLESNDFDVNTNYCIVGIKGDMADGASPQKLEYAFEKLIYSFKTH